MTGLFAVWATAGLFLGTHFVLSHPLRQPLVRALGEGGFSALYSVVAIVTFGATVFAYRAAPLTPMLWDVGSGLWAVSTVATLGASVLLLGSLIRNPALPGAGKTAGTASARGVFSVTRHPMMWGFAFWGIAHILVYPIGKNIVLAGAIVVLALVGAAMQDRKKAALDPHGWTAWQARTSYWPFLAVAQGRARLGGFRLHEIAGGLIVWLVATWAHLPLAGGPAGIWRWMT